MAEHREITIDLDVHRYLESKRKSFNETPNDILRGIAGLPPNGASTLTRKASWPEWASPPRTRAPGPEWAAPYLGQWSGKGAALPAGTRLRMTYDGKLYSGIIEDYSWRVGDRFYRSPSAAASGATGVSLNGWLYWQAQLPGSDEWKPISSLRTVGPTPRSR